MRDSGRNCSFFPIARGRFASRLKTREDNRGLFYFVPSSVHTADVFWRVFFSYVLLFMIAFAVLMLGVNNSGWDLTPLFQHEKRDVIFIFSAVILLLPFFLFPLIASFKPYPLMHFNPSERTIIAGYRRGKEWTQVVHQYSFSDLDRIEVLRNYEFRTEGYVGRSGGHDSYELNLHFSRDGNWLGITESARRQILLKKAEYLSSMTGAPYVENNVSDRFEAEASYSVDPQKTQSSPETPLPPFLMDRMGEPVHSVEVIGSKLKRKGNPFRMKIGDEFGQGFLDHIMPLVGHLVNKEPYERSLGALEFLCSDRDDPSSRSLRLDSLKAAGWRGEDELLALLAIVYDARSGPVPGLNVDRDSFERYYMTLKDKLRVSSVKYRILFFEYMDKIIEQYPQRIRLYEENPGTLQKVQNSENYALRFILDVAAIVVIIMSYFIARVIFSFFGSAVVSNILSAAFIIGLVYLWRRLRKKLG